MTKTFCDRCGAEAPVLATGNPLAKEGRPLDYEHVRAGAEYHDELADKYCSDDGHFVFNPELCLSCRIELARKLIGFMEAHKS